MCEPRICESSRGHSDDELRDALDLLSDLDPPSDERNPEWYRWTTFVQALIATAEFRSVL